MGLEKDSPTRVLTTYEIARALKELPSWRERQGALVCAWEFPDSREAIDFLAIVAEAAERQGHHPDVDWRWNTIFLSTTSHDVGSEVTLRDVALATLLEFAASDSNAVAAPQRHQDVQLGIDTQDPARLEDFWINVMGYRKGRDGDLVDPEGRNPRIWFQETATPNPNRLHIDKYISHSGLDHARAALEVNTGTGDRTHEPSWTIYSDADGNRVCLCTEQGNQPPAFE
jgi:4a-hydroxytetrahydrobiopterin dehydratase